MFNCNSPNLLRISILSSMCSYTVIYFRVKRSKAKAQPPPQKAPIADARNKIISKKRTQITDAREKLSQLAKQKDARFKLEKLRLERVSIS